MDGVMDGARRLAAAALNSAVLSKVLGGIVALICYHFVFRQNSSRLFPLWGPIEIALTTYVVSAGGWGLQLYSLLRRYNGSLFGLSKKHQVLIDYPNIDRFLSQGVHTLEVLPSQFSLIFKVFGSPDTPEFHHDAGNAIKPLLSVVEKEFVNDTASTAAMYRGDVQHHITSLVSFTQDDRQMKSWERPAGIKVIEERTSDHSGAVEADLQSLIRNFGATIAIPVLYGHDFLERNPRFLEDFWKFDNDLFPLLMVGIPPWMPFKMMKDGLAARDRLLASLRALYRRIDQHQKGEPVDFGADMSDVGIATERNKVYSKYNVSINHRADMDFSFVWGQNANTQPLLFWYIAYVYSTPGLLESLRKEIAPWVKVSTHGPAEIESMDIPSLYRECPLMKSALFETYRLGSEATSIRRVAKPMTLVDGDYKHELQPGTYISAPFAPTQNNPDYFPEPRKFIPDRFLEFDAETGKQVPRYGRLRPWGVGHGSCKGRTFAEKEILTIAAAMMSVWDMEPAGGTWKIPAMLPGTGARKPVQDIRVILRRRCSN